MHHGHITAEAVSVDSDEGRFTLEIVSAEDDPITVDIHGIDLDAFYDQVKGRIGPYLQERDEARTALLMDPHNLDGEDGYDLDDPKHPRYHSIHADIYDARAGK